MGLLHERIKKARTDLHLSQNYVAKCIGINRTAIVEIESGKRKVSADELGKFSELFHISADELLKGRTVETSTYGFEYRLETYKCSNSINLDTEYETDFFKLWKNVDSNSLVNISHFCEKNKFRRFLLSRNRRIVYPL